jgi:hypothetical protein
VSGGGSGVQVKREREILVRGEEGQREQIGEDKNTLGYFCICLIPWRHVACHVGFGCSCGVFGTSHETLTQFRDPGGGFESLGT